MAGTGGVITVASCFSFDETVDRVLREIERQGLSIFLDLDQQAAARTAGLEMRRARLLLFGRPSAGTKILIDAPEAGIELPLKAYLWEAADGGVFVTSPDPADIAARQGLSADLAAPLFAFMPLLKRALADEVDGQP